MRIQSNIIHTPESKERLDRLVRIMKSDNSKVVRAALEVLDNEIKTNNYNYNWSE